MQTQSFEILTFESAQSFIDACLDWLLENGVCNNSLVSVVQAIAGGKSGFGNAHWFAAIAEGKRIRGCAIYEELDGLMTTSLPKGSHELVANSVIADGITVRKIYGPETDSAELACVFCENESRDWTVTHRWDCYAAHTVEWPAHKANGELRRTNSDEQPTIEAWAEQYAEEKPAPVPVKDFILRKMQDGDLYVWDDSGPKMMLSVSGHPPVCARISAAFTPRKYRSRGYASNAVATLTSQLLSQGHRQTSLMIETGEQHLHRMYRRIGFEKKDSMQNIALTEDCTCGDGV